jgi:hypothetical protein
MTHFRNIMKAIMRIDIREAISAAKVCAPYLGRIAAFDGEPVLVKVIGTSKVIPTPVPLDALLKLTTIDPRGDVLETLLIEPSAPNPPGDKSISGYYQKRMLRAIDLIDTFMREGGATEVFRRKAHSVVEADEISNLSSRDSPSWA